MSETENPTTSDQASVVPLAEQATLKRSIQNKQFATADDKAEVAFKKISKTLGQIVGQVFMIKEKTGELPSGEVKTSLLAIGDFEAVNYATGEVITSTSWYGPGYFMETLQSFKEAGAQAIDVAVEIVLVPTGKSIPVAYEVRPLIARRPENKLNQLKLELQRAGRLRLPAPTPQTAGLLKGEVAEVPEDEVIMDDDETGGDETGAEHPGAGATEAADGKAPKKGAKTPETV